MQKGTQVVRRAVMNGARTCQEVVAVLDHIDQQVIEAEKRGVFDNLPGTGKPIPAKEETDYTQAWLRAYLRREGVSTEELLPTPLELRKESERLTAALPGLPSERAVRDT
jgi:hypothetical protein